MDYRKIPNAIWNRIYTLFNDFLKGGNTWQEAFFVYILLASLFVIVFPDSKWEGITQSVHGLSTIVVLIMINILFILNLYNLFFRGFVETKLFKKKFVLTNSRPRKKVGTPGTLNSFYGEVKLVSKDKAPLQFGIKVIDKRNRVVIDSTLILGKDNGSIGLGFYKSGGGKEVDWSRFDLKNPFKIVFFNDNGYVTVSLEQQGKKEMFSTMVKEDLEGQLYIWTKSSGDYEIKFFNIVLNQVVYN